MPVSLLDGLDPHLAFDSDGRLFALSESFSAEGPAPFWTWDETAGYFRDLTTCAPGETVDGFQHSAAMGWDPEAAALVVVGDSNVGGGTTTWTRAAATATWTATPAMSGLVTLDVATWGRAALAHDPLRHSMVLAAVATFERGAGATDWTFMSPPISPLPRPDGGGVAAYDASRSVLVYALPVDGRLRTWEMSMEPLAWTDRTGSAPPAPLRQPALFWNATSKRAGMIGLAGNADTVEVWEWDSGAGSWAPIAPAADSAAPSNVDEIAAVAYDRTLDRVALWGYRTDSPEAPREPALWFWDSAHRWTRRSPDRWPTLWPSPLSNATLVYDSIRSRVISLTSRHDGDVELLDWDGESAHFVDRHTAGAAPWPRHMTDVSAAFDRHRRRLVMHGWATEGFETWEWEIDAQRWTLRLRTPPDVWSICQRGVMAYDAIRRRSLLWCGVMREWNGESGTWRTVPAPEEITRVMVDGATALAFDEARGRAVLVSPGPSIAEWNGATWTAGVTSASLSADMPAAAFDARRRRVVIVLAGPTANRVLSWNGAVLIDETPPSLAAMPRFVLDGSPARLVYDLRRGNLFLTATTIGTAASGGTYHVWEGSTAPP